MFCVSIGSLDFVRDDMKNIETTQRYTLGDLEKWSEIARDIDPPIRLGVFGDPVAHSLSPEMQNAALRACEIKLNTRVFISDRMN